MNVSSDDNDSDDSDDDDIDEQQQQRSLSFSSMKNEGDTNSNDDNDAPAAAANANTVDHGTGVDTKRGGILLKQELIDREEEDVSVTTANTITTTKSNTRIIVGGTSTRKIKPSYAILDGIQEEKNPQQQQQQHRVTIELTTLPAMFGRSNDADKTNPNFFGLGKIRALSRKHCTIYYRDMDGGRMEYDTEQQRCIYKPPPIDNSNKDKKKNKNTKNVSLSLLKANPYHIKESQNKSIPLLLDPETHLPTNGFYVIENLGKNKIVVDLEMITKGESIVLRNGSAIRISTFLLYFLLPTDAKYIPHKIPVDDPSSSDDSDNNDDDNDDDDDDDDDDDGKKATTGKSKSGSKVTTTKKKNTTTTTSGGTKKRSAPVPKIASSAVGSTNKKSKTTKKNSSNASGGGADNDQQAQAQAQAAGAAQPSSLKEKNNTLTKEIELLSIDVLLQKMDTAISNGLWERKHQIIGSTLCYHAVRSAGASKEIQQEIVHNIDTTTGTAAAAATAGGVSRTTIMEWIEQSKKYRKWVQQMLSNMEPRSYQASITKSLLKAGFTRTSGAGRYIKWALPKDIKLRKCLVKSLKKESITSSSSSSGSQQQQQQQQEKKLVAETKKTTTTTTTTTKTATSSTSAIMTAAKTKTTTSIASEQENEYNDTVNNDGDDAIDTSQQEVNEDDGNNENDDDNDHNDFDHPSDNFHTEELTSTYSPGKTKLNDNSEQDNNDDDNDDEEEDEDDDDDDDAVANDDDDDDDDNKNSKAKQRRRMVMWMIKKQQ